VTTVADFCGSFGQISESHVPAHAE
jgi:hypothetical protein